MAFDGVTSISKHQFCAMLHKTLPRDTCAPSDLGLTVPCVHLLLFVHRVTGLEPGLYFLLRAERDLPALQQKCHRHFLWSRADEAVPLYLLQAGDFQSVATSVSCRQSIAGEGAFSLGMIARFREELETAPYRYRHLFWETGMIGRSSSWKPKPRARGAAPGPVKRVRPFRTQQRTRKACLTPVRIKPKLAEDEPAAKAILPEPRSVKKANFYQ